MHDVVVWPDERFCRLVPEIAANANKYSRGGVSVVGGSREYPGAPILAALASARTGAGYTRLIAPKVAASVAHSHLLSIPVSSCADENGTFCAGSVDVALAACRKSNAIALGPGLGAGRASQDFVQGFFGELAAQGTVSMVLDADMLNILAGSADLSRLCASLPCVLTPHEGEAARLLGRPVSDRPADALEIAKRYSATVLLKGPKTLIADGSTVLECQHGGPELAKAGTGDVLTGIIAALMAQGLVPFDAAACGAYIHARAASKVAGHLGVHAVLPEDIIDAIGPVLVEMGA